ncbi:hypothetical protein LINGRAHAP2_LOCUS31510 [Linum grandiflorum]
MQTQLLHCKGSSSVTN